MNRSMLEMALVERTGTHLTPTERIRQEPLSTGIPAVDLLTGGVPRGGITELTGGVSSGRTSLVAAVLAASAGCGETTAYIDVTDSLDPSFLSRAGVPLDRLLWIRCGHRLEHALRIADLVLNGGGFGVTVFDMADVSPEWARRIPMSYWFRFRRAVENKPCCCVLIDPVACAGTCATLHLEMRRSAAGWPGGPSFQLLADAQFDMERKRPAGKSSSQHQFAVRSTALLLGAGVDGIAPEFHPKMRLAGKQFAAPAAPAGTVTRIRNCGAAAVDRWCRGRRCGECQCRDQARL